MADNKNIQKIFSLTDYRRLQLTSKIPERDRESYREYGYFGGGVATVVLYSIVDRIDYSNDTATASVRGTLSSTRSSLAATGNSNFGYFGGGNGPVSTVDRIDYSNDTAATSVRGPLSLARNRAGATGNSNFGYYGGGRDNASPYQTFSTIDRINYSNDLSQASVRSTLSITRGYCTGNGNSNFAYFVGGRSPGGALYYSIIDRINYSNDTSAASVRASRNYSRGDSGFTGNLSYGWLFGGTQPYISLIERIDYSNDLVLPSIRNTLSAAKSYGTASGNSNFGFYGSGYAAGPKSTVERIDYSNDTNALSIRGPLSLERFNLSSTSSHSFGGSPNSSFASNFTFPTVPNAGYFGGGSDGTNNLASIDKVDYANDTATASVRSALSVAKNSLSATGNSNFGYFAGGEPGPVSTVERIEYSSDTHNTSVRTNLQTILSQSASVGNSNFGYFSGTTSNIQRIDYSNDNTSIVGNIDNTRQFNTATSTRNFGYFSGGDIPEVSIIQRMNFSNDTANALFRTNHAFNRRQHGGVGNETYGYYGGGVAVPSPSLFSTAVERLDYANDTTQPIIRGPLTLSRRGYFGYTGSQNFGYFAGGDVPGPTYFSTIDRINFSNDTAIASVRGSLPVAKGAGAATSPLSYGGAPIYFTNPLPQVFQDQIEFDDSNTLDLPFKRVLGSYGYFGGGYVSSPVRVSTIDRIDYSNDTIIAPQRSSNTTNLQQYAATGNFNFGYFIGGFTPSSPTTFSKVERLDYSNDNSNATLRGNLPTNEYRISAVTSLNFGYTFIRFYTTIYRLNYSNDNAAPVSRGNRTLIREYVGATGNTNFGYFAGGFSPSPATYSTVDRINYSNDTAAASVRGPLSLAKYSLAGTGNSNFGYFGGGNTGTSISTVDRIDYSNDTITASVRGPLSLVKFSLAGTGNSNFGYFGGGFPGAFSTVDRINYSNDTATASVRGPLSLGRGLLSATTNARNS